MIVVIFEIVDCDLSRYILVRTLHSITSRHALILRVNTAHLYNNYIHVIKISKFLFIIIRKFISSLLCFLIMRKLKFAFKRHLNIYIKILKWRLSKLRENLTCFINDFEFDLLIISRHQKFTKCINDVYCLFKI